MTPIQQQALALSGVMLSAKLVDLLSQTGKITDDELTLITRSTLNTSPENIAELFEPAELSQIGIFDLLSLFSSGLKKQAALPKNQMRYLMSLLHLASKFGKDEKRKQQLGEFLDKANKQKEYFNEFNHPSVIGALANAYKECLSSFNFRIQVTGDYNILSQEKYADQVRALLLFGIRCAFLWQQLGGRRWHLLIKKGKYRQSLEELLEMRNH
jgi:high frequency lysogenization protein